MDGAVAAAFFLFETELDEILTLREEEKLALKVSLGGRDVSFSLLTDKNLVKHSGAL